MISRKVVAALVAVVFASPVVLPSKTNAKPNCSKACMKRVYIKHMKKTIRPYQAWINRTARCESGGRWNINTGNGFYGGMQFTLSSWRAVGGWGFPHHHSKLEQSYRSVKLLKIQGRGAWPRCGQ